MRYLIIFPFAALALAACGSTNDDGKPGTDISIDAATDSGKPVKASSDGKTGEIAIDVPGFKANIAMPKIKLDADNFDMNGVKLFPGSKVTSMNLSQLSEDKDKGSVRISFDAPATPEIVKAWFLEKLANEDEFSVSQTVNGIRGTVKGGEPFVLDLKPGESGHTIGTLAISEI
jgi:hypothetical protein